MDVDEIGFMLEDKGLSHEEIDEFFLMHYGVPGMKWGQRRAEKRMASGPDRFGNRNNAKFQRKVNRVSRVASGTATRGDIAKAILLDLPPIDMLTGLGAKGGAARTLDRNQKVQAKINAGKKNATDILLRIGGIDVRELDFSYSS